MQIQIHKKIGKHEAGSIVSTDGIDGVPASRFWRRRLLDAKTDGCCEIVTPVTKLPFELSDVDNELPEEGE